MKISKTDFVAYLDAPMHLWAIKHEKLTETEVNVFLEHLFEQGYEVEKYANRYIQEVLTKRYGYQEGGLIFQPSQEDGSFLARTDALLFNPDTKKWDMYEVKSTNDISKLHRYDVTFQYLVMSKYYDIGDVYILHLNKEYYRNGDIDLEELFVATNVNEEVEELKDEVNELRYDALGVAQMEDYSQILGCVKPKSCPCHELCHGDTPEYSIYDINGFSGSIKKIRELEGMGIRSIYDIPKDFSLAPTFRRQVDVAQGGGVYIDMEYIREDLEGIVYPLYYIDYESFNPAIPMYDGYKPYDQMPFQWSLHVQREKGGVLEHFEFIETEMVDPIPHFLTELRKVIGDTGSIMVWNKTFEGKQNERMGEIHPEFEEFCMGMNSRIYDLMDIFQGGYYADPRCKGSYSIKKVLPVLVPELSYKGMSIGDGATAMTSWKNMVYGDLDMGKRGEIRENLLRYCELDTFAMIKIYEALMGLMERKGI